MRVKKLIFHLILCAGFLKSAGQSFVPNPSFEDTVSCPTSIGQLNKAQFWVNPTQATPDFFNACSTANNYVVHVPDNGFGYQNAKAGLGYAGFYAFNKPFPNAREYVQTRLTDTLQMNHKYLVSFYVNLSNWSQYSISSIGAYFSSTPIASSNTLVLNYTPQVQNNSSIQLSDSVNWMLISDTLLSDGTEEYITIGNFRNDSQSDTAYIGWFSTNNIAYYYIDDVSVVDVESLGIQSNGITKQFNVYPNPSAGKVHIGGFARSEKLHAVEVSDVTGKIIAKPEVSGSQGMIELNLNVNDGIYFIKITGEDGVRTTEKIIVQH